MRTQAPLLAPLFRSEGQARLLSVLIVEEAELSLADLAKRAGLAYATAHREVDRLLEAGILAEQTVGRTRVISANRRSPLYAPLREILMVVTGPVALLQQELGAIDGVEAAFLYGSFAARMRGVPGDPPNDIDVMVVGEPAADAVYDACERVEEQVSRPVNPTILTREELARDSGFHEDVKANPVVPIIGELPWN